MKKRYWKAYFRQTYRTYAFLELRMKQWGSTGYQDPYAPQAVSDWWQKWFGVGNDLVRGNPTPRSLFRRLRLLDKQARLLPTDYFGV